MPADVHACHRARVSCRTATCNTAVAAAAPPELLAPVCRKVGSKVERIDGAAAKSQRGSRRDKEAPSGQEAQRNDAAGARSWR
jgi:hypothetical protein